MTSTANREIDENDENDAQVWFEACTEHRAPDADAPCTRCGWLAADHTAGLAEVIAVGGPALAGALRRAS
jgi:hypothetical protein